jgi:hypothetical protein
MDDVQGEPACCSVLNGEERACVAAFCDVMRAGGAPEDALLNAASARRRYQAQQEMNDLVRSVASHVRSGIAHAIRTRCPRGMPRRPVDSA